jgi:hypothetical protein
MINCGCEFNPPTELRVYPLGSGASACASGRIVATFHESSYSQTSWGPTGLIAYSHGGDIFLVSASGGTPTNLTADLTGPNTHTQYPTWAPSCAIP